MRKVSKFTVLIVGVCLSMVMVVGCGKTTQGDSTNRGQFGANNGRRQGMVQRTPEENQALLAPLVKAGTITQQQEDSIVSYLEKRAAERQKMAAQRQNMTPEERSNQGGGPIGQRPNQDQRPSQGQRPNLLSELVKNKTITQQQADKIAEVMFSTSGQGQTK